MCLKNADLENINAIHECYITHPLRSDDSDDVLLDTANQLEMTKRDLIKWATSKKSYEFMNSIENIDEIEVWEFREELFPIFG